MPDPRAAAGLRAVRRNMARRASTVAALLMSVTALAQMPADPTRPTTGAAQSPAAAHSAWTLSSTLISAERRIATINGQAIGVGDRVAGAVVLEILPYAVRLRVDGDGAVFELQMHAFDPAAR